MHRHPPGLWIQITTYALLLGFALLFIIPFVWIIQTSLKPLDEIYQTPPTWLPQNATLGNYITLFNSSNFVRSVQNSLVASIATTILCTGFSALAGFGFAKYRFPGKEPLFIIVLGSMMIPIIVTLVPNFLLLADLRLINTLWSIILPSAVTPFAVFWMRQYISTAVPDTLLEAARLDGAGEFRIFFSIVRPIITPGVVALSIWVFILNWNDFLRPLVYLQDPRSHTLPVYMSTLRFSATQFRLAFDLVAAAAALSTIPVLVFFILSQRAFISGATAGAIRE